MDDIKYALSVLRGFLAAFYGKAADVAEGNERASDYLMESLDYKSDIDDAFHIVFRNRLRSGALADLVSKATNRPVKNDEEAREFLISVHDKVIPEIHPSLKVERIAEADTTGLNVAAAIKKMEHGTAEERGEAVVELGNSGNADVIRPLVELLKSSNDDIKWSAIQALWRVGGPSVVESLIGMLKDNSKLVRSAAASALNQTGDERAIEPLISSLKDESEEVRSAACYALSHFGAAVVPRLIELIEQNEELADKFGHCFDSMIDPEAVEPFAAALENRNSHVRKFAARMLSNFKDERAIRSLERALEDPDANVRHHAGLSLSMLRASAKKSDSQE